MKISLIPLGLSLILGTAATSQAQLFGPAGAGALLGGIAGAAIGDHNHNTLAGAAIGAAAGFVVGSVVQSEQRAYEPAVPVYSSSRVTYVQDAPLAPAAPVIVQQPANRQVVYVSQPAQPQVVYVERPAEPQVVYVDRPAYYSDYYYAPRPYGYYYGPSLSFSFREGYRGREEYRGRDEHRERDRHDRR